MFTLYQSNRYQLIGIGLITIAWSLFIISSFNYENVFWFKWLFGSRVIAVILGISFCLTLSSGKQKTLIPFFMTYSLFIQSTHGILEGPNSGEFYSFTGVLFLLSCLTFHGSFIQWLRGFGTVNCFLLLLPFFFKNENLRSSVGNIVDNFSLQIACFFVGITILKVLSDRFLIMEKMIELQNELSRKNEEKAESLASLATQVYHDIQSPIAALDVLKAQNLGSSDNVRSLFNLSLQRLKDITNDLVVKNPKINQSLTSDEPKITEISSLIKEIMTEKKFEYQNKNEISLSFEDFTNQECFVKVVPSKFKVILSNIINNSVEASTGSNQVHLTSEVIENKVIVKVMDHGKGIPTDHLDKIFKKNFSSGKRRTDGCGLGLGLFYAQQNIEAWDGKINVQSQLGIGTEVIIQLPKY